VKYSLYPGRVRKGTIEFETSGEPHLVKYHGRAKGTVLHTDNHDDYASSIHPSKVTFCGEVPASMLETFLALHAQWARKERVRAFEGKDSVSYKRSS
jgi:hypothetical protein